MSLCLVATKHKHRNTDNALRLRKYKVFQKEIPALSTMCDLQLSSDSIQFLFVNYTFLQYAINL